MQSPKQYTELRFACFLSGGFITAILVNPLERKQAKRTSVKCAKHYPRILSMFSLGSGKLRVEIWQFFLGDLGQSENLSELKPPLVSFRIHLRLGLKL